MVYSAAYWAKSKNDKISHLAFDGISVVIEWLLDSKKLTPEKRETLLHTIDSNDSIGYVIRTLSAKEISANMLQTY